MAMGARQQRERQQGLWIAAAGIRRGGGHPLKELIRNEASPGGTALSPPTCAASRLAVHENPERRRL